MSRTYKDRPYWVKATYYEACHVNCPHDGRTKYPSRECDLPEEPVRLHNSTFNPRRRWTSTCVWEHGWDRWRFYGPVPKWYVDHRWNNVNRTRLRAERSTAIAQYRATGEVDIIFNIDQHRHSAQWDWS